MNVITSNQATRNLDQLIEQVIFGVEPTVICNENGHKAVLMGLDEFKAWHETFYLLSNSVNAEHIFQSIRDIERGEVFSMPLQ